MAKQIKVIQCPQCGGNQNERIDKDHYKCSNCGAEYILDNDDININVNHKHNQEQQAIQPLIKKIRIALVAVSLVAVIGFLTFMYIDINSAPSYQALESLNKKTNIFRESFSQSFPFVNKEKNHAFYVSERTYEREDREKNGFYAVFYDLDQGEIIKENKLEELPESSVNRSAYLSHFKSIDKHYLILNKRRIYEVNITEMSCKDMTIEIFKNHAEYDTGIASVEFSVYYDGDGFKVMTNLGKELYYYPSIDRTYTPEEYQKARHHMNTLLPDAQEKTYYTFSEKSRDYPDELIQLMEVKYMYNNGGPEHIRLAPNWSKNMNMSNTGKVSYNKELFNKNLHRVKSYKDITPERIYFSAKVLYYDNKNVLIVFKPTLDPEASLSLQLLDSETGTLLWTHAIENEPRGTTIKNDKYFIIQNDNRTFTTINIDGSEIRIRELETKVEY